MKIDSADIQMTSQRHAVEQRSTQKTLRMWVGERRPDFEGDAPAQRTVLPADTVRISGEARAAAEAASTKGLEPDADLINELRYQLLIRMVEAMTGRKVRLLKVEDTQPQAQSVANIPDPQSPARQTAGFGVEYEYHATRFEAEQTSFSAAGIVKTSDGREIRFDLTLLMSREHLEQVDVSLRAGDAVRKQDPLVINFGGTAAQLTEGKFGFDLDSDGTPDSISFVGSGSGFLVLDRNHDGKVNNGSELFGPATGNGFLELAAHDQDGNGWIDENDPIYRQLYIWTRDSNGNDRLSTLAEMAVGAISLSHIDTRFDLRNADNRFDGQIRSSGVYLREDGGVGTVQQIDLAV